MPLDIPDMADSMTIAEFAEVFHYHPQTVRRLLRIGEIEHLRIGTGRGSIRIPRRAAVDYINRSRRRDTA